MTRNGLFSFSLATKRTIHLLVELFTSYEIVTINFQLSAHKHTHKNVDILLLLFALFHSVANVQRFENMQQIIHSFRFLLCCGSTFVNVSFFFQTFLGYKLSFQCFICHLIHFATIKIFFHSTINCLSFASFCKQNQKIVALI